MVIVPTELIVDNGKKLAGIVKELAEMSQLEADFHVMAGAALSLLQFAGGQDRAGQAGCGHFATIAA